MARLARVIHVYLLLHDEASPYDIYEHTKRRYEYHSIVRYFYLLKKLDLIEVYRVERNEKDGPIKKVYYRIKPGREYDPCWSMPWKCYGIKYNYPKYLGVSDLIAERKMGRRYVKDVICKLVKETGSTVVPVSAIASYFRVDETTMIGVLEELGYVIVTTDTGHNAVDAEGLCVDRGGRDESKESD